MLRAAVLPRDKGGAAPPLPLDPEDEARLQGAGLLRPREGGGHQLRYPVYGTLLTAGEDPGSG